MREHACTRFGVAGTFSNLMIPKVICSTRHCLFSKIPYSENEKKTYGNARELRNTPTPTPTQDRETAPLPHKITVSLWLLSPRRCHQFEYSKTMVQSENERISITSPRSRPCVCRHHTALVQGSHFYLLRNQ